MDELLFKYPKWLIVAVALGLGLALILLINPPVSKCDTQFELLKQDQTPFIFKDPQKKFDSALTYENISQKCLNEKLPGSCLRFFEGLQKFLGELDSVSVECISEVLGKSEIKKTLLNSLNVTYKVAWGSKTPDSSLDKTNWFQTIELNTFCELQGYAQRYLKTSEWESFREGVIQEFVSSSGLDRKEVWSRSILSMRCP